MESAIVGALIGVLVGYWYGKRVAQDQLSAAIGRMSLDTQRRLLEEVYKR